MHFLSTRLHGALDYLMGVLLIAAPWLFGSADGADEAATWVLVALGAGVILYSLFTDYELGLVRKIPMPTHLLLDIGGGVLLAGSPWLFGFAEEAWLPHLVLGVLEVGAALVTERAPGPASTPRRRAPGLA